VDIHDARPHVVDAQPDLVELGGVTCLR